MSVSITPSVLRTIRNTLANAEYLWLIGAGEQIVHGVPGRNGVSPATLALNLPSGLALVGCGTFGSHRESAAKALRSASRDMSNCILLVLDSASESATPSMVRISASSETSAELTILSDSQLSQQGELVVLRAYHSFDLWISGSEEYPARLASLAKDLSNGQFAWNIASSKEIVSNEQTGRILLLDGEDEYDQPISTLLSDDNPLVQRKKAQAKIGSSSSSSTSTAAANSAIITGPIASVPIPEYAVEFTLLRRSGAVTSEDQPVSSPTLQYSKCTPRLVTVRIDVLHYASGFETIHAGLTALKSALMKQVVQLAALSLPAGNAPATVQALHFQPVGFTHALTAIFASSTPTSGVQRFNGDTAGRFPAPPGEDSNDPHPSLVLSKAEQGLASARKDLQTAWNIPQDRPAFRWSNALCFPSTQPSSLHDPQQYIIQPRLYNVHEHLPRGSATGGETFVVKGRYAYYHYLQDRQQDSGWGCAYRTLQSICSWFVLQGYTNDRPIPTIKDIQTILVECGDKQPKFIGSKEWIGSTEVGLVLGWCYGLVTKTLFISSGSEVSSHARVLREHFATQGTPVMIGGGVLAYGLLGVDYNDQTGECRFLILDPHYTGADSIAPILKGGWVGWKKSDLFLADHFYNFALPQRPKECV